MPITPAEYGPYRLVKRFRHDEEFSRIPQKTSWKKSIINFDEGSTFGRTPTNWLLLACFFVVFYACLVLFWWAMYLISTKNIDASVPMYKILQPGMSFAPVISSKPHPVIDYRQGISEMIDPYVDDIEKFINKMDGERVPNFGPCKLKEEYGYDLLKPCVILKINRVIGFTPETYGNVMPEEAPSELRNFIDALPPDQKLNRIWLSCKSDSKVEIDYKFYPDRFVKADAVKFEKKRVANKNKEFENKFYNYNDFDRMVAVQLNGLPQKTEVTIKCFMWAKNIAIKENGVGMVVIRFRVFPK